MSSTMRAVERGRTEPRTGTSGQEVAGRSPWRWLLALAVVGVVAAGCGRPGGPVPDAPTRVVGHCIYVNNFSHREECREYLGDGWTHETATQDCTGRGATAALDAACPYPQILGRCLLNARRPDVVRIAFPGADPALCGSSQNGCEFWGGGYFLPDPICGGVTDPGPVTSGLPVFQQPTRSCVPPRAGEAPGRGPDGQVCTWSAVAGATEEGRHFEDYASCDQVRTQRPYYARPPATATPPADPRMQDPAYVRELGWVRSQVESSACICCHSSRLTPSGPSNWYVEAPGNWMDSFYNMGLALGAGWVDSSALGAYPAEHNNGFARTPSGIPSTDSVRMARFFASELAHRGRTREDFATARPFGGPIYDQLVYQPTACTAGQGVAADGTVSWTGGPARYVYVLDQGSANPGVPPNLDLPAGTRWRIDVASTDEPVPTGLRYGQAPAGATQRFPVSAAPAPLVAGATYYLYVLADVGVPVTRCLFTYPR